MNTSEQIIAEAHKQYSDLKVDLNWKPIDSMDDRRAFLFSPKYDVGISLEEYDCYCDDGAKEKIFSIVGYAYVHYPYLDSYWKPLSHFTGPEKEVRAAIFDFCYKLDQPPANILQASLSFFPDNESWEN